MPNLFDLPNELILRILKDVKPLDLLRMSQACTQASKILSDRVAWEKALRRVYARESLFEPSFEPIHSMDVDGLRKAALRFHCVHAKLSKGSGRVYPTRETLLNCPLEGVHMRFITGVQIVPGGRYVLGVASSKHICLWDLGPPGSNTGASEGALIFTADVECQVIVSISCPSPASNDSFRFAVHVAGTDAMDNRIHVYSVGPLPSVGRIQPLAFHRLSVDDGPELVRYWVAGDKVFVQRANPDSLTVWDFVSAKVASFPLPGGTRDQSPRCTSFDDFVVVLHQNELCAYQSQDLQPIGSPGSSTGQPNAGQLPTIHSQYQSNTAINTGFGPMRTASFLLPSNWPTPCTGPSTTFDIVTYSCRPMIVKRLHLNSSNKGAIRATVLSTTDSWLESLVAKGMPFQFYTRGDDNLYILGRFIERGGLLHYSSLKDDESEEKWKAVICMLGHDIRWQESTLFCPYSGRFAYVCDIAHDDGCNRIHVVDLLDR